MISKQHSGAHRHEYLTGAGHDMIDGWHRTAGVAMVTIAPELDNAPDVISELVRRGIVVAAGHSAATADETRASIAAGVSTVTHLFNAMAPLRHRSPNLVGVALADARLTVTMIVDGRAHRPHRGGRGLEGQGARGPGPGDRRGSGDGAAARPLPDLRHTHRLRRK